MTAKPKEKRFGLPPSQAEVRHNIERPTLAATEGGKTRYINFRIAHDKFVEIKTAALKQGLTLGDYLILTHEAYQNRGDIE